MSAHGADQQDSTAGLTALATRVLEAARAQHRTLASAESCTGGLVAHLLTEVPGASEVYLGGWVVYSNTLKASELVVPAVILQRDGAVSEAVALALARGARERAGADLAVATTGIAGPGGGSPEKPVGLVWVAVADADGARAQRGVVPPRPRDEMKRAFAHAALLLLLKRLPG